MIISGGENVYSAEVENAMYQFSEVSQCAVIGVPDDKWGERVHAIVVLEENSNAKLRRKKGQPVDGQPEISPNPI